jgi:hypothetical protein
MAAKPDPEKKPPRKRPARKASPAKKTTSRRAKPPEEVLPPVRPDLWERQDEESDPAWEAFALYRDMGLFRSLSKVAADVGKDLSLIKGWSRKHSWVIRCRAWDAELDKQDRATVIEARRQMRDRHLELAKDVQDRVVTALELFDAETLAKSLGPNELIRWLDVSTKVERAALDVGDGHTSDGRGGRRAAPPASGSIALTVEDFDAMTDEERFSRMLTLQKEFNSRMEDRSSVMSGGAA